jgi:lipopolysaccharide export system permease protein
MKQKLNHFKRQKIAEATLNIAPNKLSQNFGSFHVFVQEKDPDGSYRDMVLFNKENSGKYQLFLSQKGEVTNDGKRFTLTLSKGRGETSGPQKVQTLRYDTLRFFQYPHADYGELLTSWEYWQQSKEDRGRRGKLLYLIFVSLSPLLGFGLTASLTFYNPRYQRSISALVILVVALSIYIPAAILQKSGSLPLFVGLLLFMIVLNILLVRRKILGVF